MFRPILYVKILILALTALPAAAGAAPAAQPFVAFVSVQPQAAFVRAVGGEYIRVAVMVPPGRSHETYDPTPRQMQELTQAQLYFRVGLPFEESWIPRIRHNNPGLKIVDTRQGIHLLNTQHPHEPGEAAHGADPHIWMDPNLVKIQARTIRDALVEIDPAHRKDYERNFQDFTARLTQLDLDLRRILSRAPSRRFMVYHPSWGYFAKAYGLEQVPIEIEGKEPGPRSLAAVIETARKQGVKTLFVQKQFSSRSAQVIAQAIGGRVVPVDDMPDDYFGELRALAHWIAGEQP